MKTTKKTTKKPAATATPTMTPERERALLECFRLIYRTELVSDTLDLGYSDDLGDLRNKVAWELADHDGRLGEFRDLGRAAREVTP